MTDYLTRLAERTLGTAAMALPDLSALAAVAATAAAGRPDAEDQGMPVGILPETRPSGSEQAQGAAAGGTAGQVKNRAAAETRSLKELVEHTPPHVPSTAPPARSSQQRERSASPIEVPSGRGSASDHAPDREPPHTQTGHAAAAAARAPLRPDAPGRLDAPLRNDQPEGPAITITIGRIEVRSVKPVVHTTTAPSAKPSQLRSLHTYLRERNGSGS
jgi:hypothetical protein